MRWFAWTALALMLGCGGRDVPQARRPQCRVTVSSVGVVPCRLTPLAAWTSSNDEGSFSLSAFGHPAVRAVYIGIEFPDEPRERTYKDTDDLATGVVEVAAADDSARSWRARAGGSGSYALRLATLGTETRTSNGKRWSFVHGTLDATLVDVSDASSTLTVHADF
jgi:hypothetical protein